eukprot:6858337-Heterocapsa_arctica.AAC.1
MEAGGEGGEEVGGVAGGGGQRHRLCVVPLRPFFLLFLFGRVAVRPSSRLFFRVAETAPVRPLLLWIF